MRWIALCLAVVGPGCAHAYHAEVTAIGDERHMIRSAPDGESTSEGLATQYAYRRASEVCPNGYDIIESRAGTTSSTERVAIFGRRTIETPEVTLIVRCR